MSALYWAKALAESFFDAQLMAPLIVWKRNNLGEIDHSRLFIANKEVSKDDLQKTVRQAIENCYTLLNSKILMNFNMNIPATIPDEPRNTNANFCFLQHKDNQELVENSKLFNKHILDKGMFLRQDLAESDNTPPFNMSAVENWLHEVQAFTKLIVFLVHVTGGLPGRATELAALQVRNTAVSQRHVMFVGNNLVLKPTYNKTNSMLKREKVIYRFLVARVRDLYLKYFILVRPMEM